MINDVDIRTEEHYTFMIRLRDHLMQIAESNKAVSEDRCLYQHLVEVCQGIQTLVTWRDEPRGSNIQSIRLPKELFQQITKEINEEEGKDSNEPTR